jgi:hypothetical protein
MVVKVVSITAAVPAKERSMIPDMGLIMRDSVCRRKVMID